MPDVLEKTTVIGRVIDVSGQIVHVLVESVDWQNQSVAELGSYVTIPIESRKIIGLITSMRMRNPHDHSLSEAIITVQMLGQIQDGKFLRGMQRYPVVGGHVRCVEDDDLDVIFGKGADHDGSLHFVLGTFAMNDRYSVYLSGKHFFSKHAAILGNSGSGKSCTAARVISESIKCPDAQVILFDLHDEYTQAFCNDSGQLLPNVTSINEKDMVVPYWFLSYQELAMLFVDKSNPQLISNQRSFLREALLKLKSEAAKNLGLEDVYNVDTPIYFSLDRLRIYAENLNEARFVLNTDRFAFARTGLRNLDKKEQDEIMISRPAQFNQGQPEGEIAHPLYHQKLNGLIDLLDHKINDRRYDFLLRPIEQAGRSEQFMRNIPQAKHASELDWSQALGWLVRILTGQLNPRRNLTIVDLSGIPFDIVDLTVGLLTRIIFDYNFYSPADQRRPVALVYEEAHNYIPRENHSDSFARVAVERVAKEGRKYGVSCIVISQRPSELSHTVLSQCNNLIVMRLSSPEDQQYITKVVSDQFAELIRLLPTLRAGEAFVIGDSVAMPLRTQVQLPDHLPSSEDIDFFKRWSQQFQAAPPEQVIQHWWRQDRP